MALLKLIRAANLLMMALTQLLAVLCLTQPLLNASDMPQQFYWLVLSTILAAAGGYIINDYHDIHTDRINKPESLVVGKYISRRQSMFLHLTCTALGILIASRINQMVMWLVTGCCVALWFYAFSLKKKFVSGNILVAALSAFTLLILWYLPIPFNNVLLLCYAGFAFLCSIIREIVKDLEDMEGDRADGGNTIPLTLGILKTRKLLIVLTLLLLFLIILFTIGIWHRYTFQTVYGNYGFAVHAFTGLLIPTFILVFRMNSAQSKPDFHSLSNRCKLIMLSGLLSMLWFRF